MANLKSELNQLEADASYLISLGYDIEQIAINIRDRIDNTYSGDQSLEQDVQEARERTQEVVTIAMLVESDFQNLDENYDFVDEILKERI